MGLPHTLKILSCSYSVEYLQEHNFDDDCMGDLDGDNIRIRSDISPQRQIEVILHETLHAMIPRQLGDDAEERLVTTLSESLTQFFIDNPNFILYALGVLAPKDPKTL